MTSLTWAVQRVFCVMTSLFKPERCRVSFVSWCRTICRSFGMTSLNWAVQCALCAVTSLTWPVQCVLRALKSLKYLVWLFCKNWTKLREGILSLLDSGDSLWPTSSPHIPCHSCSAALAHHCPTISIAIYYSGFVNQLMLQEESPISLREKAHRKALPGKDFRALSSIIHYVRLYL